MISILVVADSPLDLASASRRHPEVEILHAQGCEETVEKLARNRRIDAVLLLSGGGNCQLVDSILEENPAPPPLFVPRDAGPLPIRTRALPGSDLPELIDLILREIEAPGAPEGPP